MTKVVEAKRGVMDYNGREIDKLRNYAANRISCSLVKRLVLIKYKMEYWHLVMLCDDSEFERKKKG